MKSVRMFIVLALLTSLSTGLMAQSVKEKITVNGNCGMCQNKIEKAAKAAGADYASWDADTKILTVEYKSVSTNNAKIQQAVAATGYDTQEVTALDALYNKLPGCCKYDRSTVKTTAKADCCKDGKCSIAGHNGKDCCKTEACKKEGHSGMDCCKKS